MGRTSALVISAFVSLTATENNAAAMAAAVVVAVARGRETHALAINAFVRAAVLVKPVVTMVAA